MTPVAGIAGRPAVIASCSSSEWCTVRPAKSSRRHQSAASHRRRPAGCQRDGQPYPGRCAIAGSERPAAGTAQTGANQDKGRQTQPRTRVDPDHHDHHGEADAAPENVKIHRNNMRARSVGAIDKTGAIGQSVTRPACRRGKCCPARWWCRAVALSGITAAAGSPSITNNALLASTSVAVMFKSGCDRQ